jgi:5S rRNA maturation endonuclease (ribonuclease M5)
MNKSRSPIDYSRLNALAQLVCFRLEDLFEKLEIELRRSGKMYIGCCPIHLGDNYSALNLYPEGDKIPGIWRCNTHQCHKVFQKTIIGFVRGVLSQKYFNWNMNTPTQDIAPFDKTIRWLCKFVEKDWNDIRVDERTEELNRFANQISTFKKVASKQSGLPRADVRRHLQIPAHYYLERRYRFETLDRFDIGLCDQPGKEMYNRVVVPIYEDSGKLAVGFTGRSIFEKCKCGFYHSPSIKCPTKNDGKKFSKWRHVGNTGHTLYNWWNARSRIKESATAILVEGPGDVWRLAESGVDNSVAMFGADLTDEQQILLEKSGAMKIVVIRDNDPTGISSEQHLRELLQRSYKLRFITPSAKDVGEMTVPQIKQEIIPCLI